MQITDLPEAAGRKFFLLDDERASAEASARDATMRLGQLQSTDADPRIRERLQDRMSEMGQRHAELSRLVNNLKVWINKVRAPMILEPVPPASTAGLVDGGLIAEAIERLRDQISASQYQLSAIENAPLPTADQKRMVEAEVQKLALRGQPIINIDNRSLRIDWVDPRRAEIFTREDSAAMLAWLFPEAMQREIERMVLAIPDTRDALSAADRAVRVRQIAETLEALGRQEESLIEEAEATGIRVMRRDDADPKCVLGVRVVPAQLSAVA